MITNYQIMENSKYKYFTRLQLENIKCFGSKQPLDLSDGNGSPTRWNLILGDNGVGKTTLLQCLAWMRPEAANEGAERIERIDDEDGVRYERTDQKSTSSDEGADPEIILVPSLQNEDDNSVFEMLPQKTSIPLRIFAELSNGRRLVNSDAKLKGSKKDKNSKAIVTGVEITFEDDGTLKDYDSKGSVKIQDVQRYKLPFIVVYGANRYMGKDNKEDSKLEDSISNRLTNNNELFDVEQILQDLEYAVLKFKTKKDEDYFETVKKMIVRVLHLDSTKDIHINPKRQIKDSKNPDGVRFDMFSGEVSLTGLSLGYQTTLAWTFDLAWRLYQNYPESDNALAEPAIVLIDEIDLHLHPEWQRQIMDDLSSVFTETQFIATAHSPLMVQAKPNANFAVIKKCETEVVIENEPELVKGWRVDQILNSEYFGVKISRPPETERLFERRERLLMNLNRSSEEEIELRVLQDEISNLRTETNPNADEAMIYLQKAADLLKAAELTKHDKDK